MTISFECKSGFTERRRKGRANLGIEVFMRERSRSAMATRLVDLNSFGARIEGMIVVQPEAQLWLKLPGLDSLAVRRVWSEPGIIAVEFETPLHPAVAARFMPADGSLAAELIESAEYRRDPLLSRREQIMAGIAGSDQSPLQRKKKPSGIGLSGRISRAVTRQADTRAERRFDDAVPEGTSLAIEGAPVQVLNVSPSGMKVRGDLGEREIGDTLALEFEGFETLTGQLVWMNGAQAGIALPPQSIDLVERGPA